MAQTPSPPPSKRRQLFERMNNLIHNMPFADYLAAPGVSNSLLSKFRRCPLLAHEMNQGLIKDEPTDAMLIGKLTDEAIFNPDGLPDLYYLKPDVVGGEKWQGNRTACKAWKAEHADKPVISPEQLGSVHAMVNAVWNDPFAADLLKGAKYQASLFAKHIKTGLPRKGRPDGMGDGFLLDLKKVADASTGALSRSIATYGWYVQAAYYLDLCESLDIEANDFYFIAVEPGQRPKVNVRYLDQYSVSLGRWVCEKALVEYAECAASGIWPSYTGKKIESVRVAAWEENRVMGNLETINLEA